MKKTKKSRTQKRLRREALRLLGDPAFLSRTREKFAEQGLVGEEVNALIIFLAVNTMLLPSKVSVMVKGPSSSGKSNLIKSVLQLLPASDVLTRTSMSKKALAHGDEDLDGKVLYVLEYQGGKEAQYMMRQLQSEGVVAHEATRIAGSRRETVVAERFGTPVLLTTTTDAVVHQDDETRCLSLSSDVSAAQTRRILEREILPSGPKTQPANRVWHEAFRVLREKKIRVEYPEWLGSVAANIPATRVRVRRDWKKFLTLCAAVTLPRTVAHQPDAVEIVVVPSFADYCVAYRLLNDVLDAGIHDFATQEWTITAAVKALNKTNKGVKIDSIAERLGWKSAVTYKHVARAVEHGLLQYIPGVREQNLKLLIPGPQSVSGFLPSPKRVLNTLRSLPSGVSYIDPLTGKKRIAKR